MQAASSPLTVTHPLFSEKNSPNSRADAQERDAFLKREISQKERQRHHHKTAAPTNHHAKQHVLTRIREIQVERAFLKLWLSCNPEDGEIKKEKKSSEKVYPVGLLVSHVKNVYEILQGFLDACFCFTYEEKKTIRKLKFAQVSVANARNLLQEGYDTLRVVVEFKCDFTVEEISKVKAVEKVLGITTSLFDSEQTV